jgi:hypothetical protein
MDEAHLEQRLQEDIEKQYEAKPVIVVADKDQYWIVEGIMKRNKWRWTDSRSPNFLLEIR